MAELDRILRNQDGVISHDQARAVGLSDDQIGRRARSGAWRRIGRRVFLAANHELTERGAHLAAGLLLGPNAVIIHRSAALLWQLPVAPPPAIQVAAPRHFGKTTLALDVRDYFIDPTDITERDGIRLTARPFSAITAAADLETLRAGDGLALLDRCLQLRISHRSMERALDRHPRHRGARVARALLKMAGDESESYGERETANLLKGAGLSGWKHQVWAHTPMGTFRVDFAFEADLVAVEFDGFAFHSDPERFNADRRRRNALTAAGWTIVHVTWHDLVARPDGIVEEVRLALAMRRSA